jgi:hypothetical protein
VVSQHYFVGSVPQHPVLKVLRSTGFQQFFNHLLEKQLDFARIVQVKLAQENHLLVVGQHLAEILNRLVVFLLAVVVEDDVYGLVCDAFEVELRPDYVFEFTEPFLVIKDDTSSR